MAFQAQRPHFLLVPFMSRSNLIPFTDMAKALAHHGLTVTIIMTPLNVRRHNKVLEYARTYDLKIHFLSLPFPCQEVGLPEGCENVDSLPSPDLVPTFFKANNMLQEPVEKWLQGLESKPSCIISDICLPWTTDVALKFKLSRVIFHVVSCFTLFCYRILAQYKILEGINSDDEYFSVPGIPDRIEFAKKQILKAKNQLSPEFKAMLDRSKAAELSAEGVLVNTFEELEADYVNGYRKVVKNVWCIGPLFLQNKAFNYEPHQSLKWLDSKKQASVLYVCFGSQCHILGKQLIEIGLGLEASKHPFIWVVKEDKNAFELEKWLMEEQFEQRIKERGLVIRGWAPQALILSHPGIGGFLTHCGWNSTLEGISSGMPMITWPMFAKQFMNEKLIVQVLKTGVSIGVETPMTWGAEEKLGVMVTKDEIQKAVDSLMDEGTESEDIRRRAKELGKMAKKTVQEGSSFSNMTSFIQHVIEQVTTG